jgi:hypothetical protein
MESERDIIDYVRAGKLAMPPLLFRVVREKPEQEAILRADLLLETTWQGKKRRFVGKVKRYGSDNMVQQAAEQARKLGQALHVYPLVIVPWLSPEQLLWLEKEEVSGVDLCGNGVVVVPGQLLVLKSGQPNKFPGSRLIRRVYEGSSSLVARVFLLRPEYRQVSQVLEEIIARGGNITLPTVSKALKQLEEDVVIEKSKQQVRLLQAEKLLDRLRENFEPPKTKDLLRCKITISDNTEIRRVLQEAAHEAKARLVLSGESSVNFYATMAREPIDTVYCTEFPMDELKRLGVHVDFSSRFPNVELRRTDVETVYFDMRGREGYNIASPIQSYLELAVSDKRGQETAEQVRQQIVIGLQQLQGR